MLDPPSTPPSLLPLTLRRTDEGTPATFRRIVGLPEEEDAIATSQGTVRTSVSPVAEMFRPVGLLLHSQSVPCFGNYENISHLDTPKSDKATSSAGSSSTSTTDTVSACGPTAAAAALGPRRVHVRPTDELRKPSILGGRRSASSSVSSAGRFSTTTHDTLLPPDTLFIPDIIIPPSSLFPPPGLQLPVRRSSAESPGIAPELKQIEHVSQLDFPDEGPPCLFCRSPPSSTTHDPSMLSTLSGGLVRSRDGGRGGAPAYMNLPSPNVAAEEGEQRLFTKDGGPPASCLDPRVRCSTGHHEEASDSDTAAEEAGPPPSSMTRRAALVPPKLLTDGAPYDESETEPSRPAGGSQDDCVSRHKRRSSIVVIPPMQVCPGDLLVYSKVLTQRTNLLDLDGSTHSLSVTDTDGITSRKGKNTWSLLKLFDRSNRTKSDSQCGLEEVLSLLRPSEFEDKQLSKYKGMCWNDFVAHKDGTLKENSPSSKEDSSTDNMLDKIAQRESQDCLGSLPSHGSMNVSDRTSLLGRDGSEKRLADLVEGSVVTKRHHPLKLMRTMSERTLDRGRPSNFFSLLSERVHLEKSSKFVNPPAIPMSTVPPQPSPTHHSSSLSPCLYPKPFPSDSRATLFSSAASPTSAGTTGEGTSPGHQSASSATQSVSLGPPILSPGVQSSSGAAPATETKDSSAAAPPSDAEEPPSDLCSLEGVERMLEAAKDNAQAALNKNETKRREAVWDLFQSECTFLYDHLMVLKNVYMEPLKKIQVDGFAMFAEPELLFGNLDELCCVTYAFCKEFINLLELHQAPGGQLDTTKVLVKLFRKGSKATMLCQAYHRYALNYINALNYLETLRRQVEFCEFEKWCNRDPRCKKLQLTDLLVAPVQHIMKVPLILRDIEARTEEPQERAVVREIIEAEESSLRELDDKMKWLKNFERLLEIQKNIFWPPITELDPKVYIPEFLKSAIARQPCERLIVSPRRQIIMEGALHLLDNNKPQEMYVILFDDMLLITRRKKGLSKKKSSLSENWPSSCSRPSSGESAMRYIVYKQPLSLDRFFLHDVPVSEAVTAKLESAFVMVNLNRFQQIVAVYTFLAQTDQAKQTWLLKLRDTQDKWKRTLQNTVFRNHHRLSVPAASPPKPHPLDPKSFV
ncbi:uncharacterized protein LOC125177788 [Hyalella azteca]|uniref:Uncharacterized protein LOC125177788 n=1 Tax=Hyalella azteca TaxID=294128 RepID=A0A979FGT4_HYAAZ|nr:uncharacterized protein LOC125177788 [Hyalella azteca]